MGRKRNVGRPSGAALAARARRTGSIRNDAPKVAAFRGERPKFEGELANVGWKNDANNQYGFAGKLPFERVQVGRQVSRVKGALGTFEADGRRGVKTKYELNIFGDVVGSKTRVVGKVKKRRHGLGTWRLPVARSVISAGRARELALAALARRGAARAQLAANRALAAARRVGVSTARPVSAATASRMAAAQARLARAQARAGTASASAYAVRQAQAAVRYRRLAAQAARAVASYRRRVY